MDTNTGAAIRLPVRIVWMDIFPTEPVYVDAQTDGVRTWVTAETLMTMAEAYEEAFEITPASDELRLIRRDPDSGLFDVTDHLPDNVEDTGDALREAQFERLMHGALGQVGTIADRMGNGDLKAVWGDPQAIEAVVEHLTAIEAILDGTIDDSNGGNGTGPDRYPSTN